jgi:hypothetical protein
VARLYAETTFCQAGVGRLVVTGDFVVVALQHGLLFDHAAADAREWILDLARANNFRTPDPAENKVRLRFPVLAQHVVLLARRNHDDIKLAPIAWSQVIFRPSNGRYGNSRGFWIPDQEF